jgi:glycerol uptake facilitator-like aquaporin
VPCCPAGFAFFAPLQIFAKVSAKLNPAMCLAQWVWGNLTGVDFICLSLAELAGAFVGEIHKRLGIVLLVLGFRV